MASILQDIGYALRTLGRSPGFTAVVVLTLGLGIGANTTVFSLVDTILLEPPAGVTAPESLVDVYTSDYSGPPFGASSYPDYEDFASNVDELSGLAAFQWQPFSVSTGGEAFSAFGEYASRNYFRVLGVTPALGRGFDADEGSGDDLVTAVIGYGLWQQRFGGARDVIGRTLRVRGQPVTIVGVAPKGFTGTQSGIGIELWVPYRLQPLLDPSTTHSITDRGSRGLFLVGRLAAGETADAARAAFDALATNLHATYPQQWTDVRSEARRITVLEHRQAAVMPEIRGAVVSFLTILVAVAALVLAITCANLANLLLTRAAGRTREIGVRTALGATRRRIVRLLLAESLLLASMGGLCGIALAAAAGELLAGLKPPIPIPIVLNLAPGGRVLVFAAVVSVLAGMLLGMLPALRASRVRLGHGLRHDVLTSSRGRRLLTLRNGLVVGQVAVSSALLVVMGLFVQSLVRAQAADLGFRPEQVAIATFDLEAQGYTAQQAGQFLDTLEDTVRQLPGVQSATFAKLAPLGLDYARQYVGIETYQPGPGEDMEVGTNVIDENYFATLGIELLRGRTFSTRDRQGAPAVAIVNDAFVRRYWPDGRALGRHIDFGAGPAEVVGVVADAKYRSIRDEALPYFYTSRRQNPAMAGTLEVRTEGDPASVFPALRSSLSALDPAVVFELTTMREHLGVAVLAQRVGATLIGAFGGIGALLAALGLYGVLSYLVARRTREIGIRMALGSDPSAIMRMVLGRAAGLTLVGLAIGLAMAFAAARLVAGFLYGIDARDPATFIAAGIFFAAIALAAAFGPALRATHVDPSDALRSE